MKTILVLFGGCSTEYEVSLHSAYAVLSHMDPARYTPLAVGITREGQWLCYTGDLSRLEDGTWQQAADCIPCTPLVEREAHALLLLDGSGRRLLFDAVFPVLHGKNGEDGTIQGFLQVAGIPFVGCDMLSSACCMDKAMTNTLADAAGIPQAKWLGFTKYEYGKAPEEYNKKAEDYLGFPIFVKPANAGSSVGVTKAVDAASLKKAIGKAFNEDSKIVLEEGVDGMEVECAVLGNEEPIASICGEIVPCNDFYDYEAKYVNPSSELHIPARLPKEKIDEVRTAACNAYKSLGCSGLARVDFFVRHSDGKVMLNEPNTIPGFTSISMYPKMFAASGIPYSELIDRLLTLAMEKWDR